MKLTNKEAFESIVVDLVPQARENNKREIKQIEEELTKLGQLEDIEQELGIDLITLFKVLKKGVYYCNTQREINHAKKVRLSFAYKTLIVDRHIYKYLTDYGITWALTKGELSHS